ncbi:hypothetical protein KPSB59_4540007 [Klebsiella quasipneumoniae subsp. quasipneumoniae]|nr:hypothetical protein KPSB59_4540007 [Klebsiella quasipneumoniae subsp. quasipneumoniae]
MLSDNSDGQIQGKQNYEVLVARYLNERAVLVDREACCSGMVWFPWLLCRPNHLHTNSCGHHMA